MRAYLESRLSVLYKQTMVAVWERNHVYYFFLFSYHMNVIPRLCKIDIYCFGYQGTVDTN